MRKSIFIILMLSLALLVRFENVKAADAEYYLSIMIPKMIELEHNQTSTTYQLHIKGFVQYDRVLTIIPSQTFELKDEEGDKESVIARVIQKRQSFPANELYDYQYFEVEGTIEAEGLSAGKWVGSINFKIRID